MGRYSFREFTFGFTPEKGSHDLRVHAWNRSGQSQPMGALWQPARYLRNVVESVKITAARGEPDMTRKHRIASTDFVTALGFAAVSSAGSKTMDLPPDGTQLKASTLPGYAKTQANCTACHSA